MNNQIFNNAYNSIKDKQQEQTAEINANADMEKKKLKSALAKQQMVNSLIVAKTPTAPTQAGEQ